MPATVRCCPRPVQGARGALQLLQRDVHGGQPRWSAGRSSRDLLGSATMDYVIKNLRDVEDMAPKFGFDAVQEARFPWRDLGAERTGLAFMRVKPGQRQASAHRHQEAEEIYVVVGGSGRI